MTSLFSANCVDCHRTNYSRHATAICSSCGGRLVPTTQKLARDPTQAKLRRSECVACGHFGSHSRNGKSIYGCGLLAKPCSVEDRWYLPTQKWCPKHTVKHLRRQPSPTTTPVAFAAIITTHYNPAGFTRLRETWREWQPTVGDVITMELAIDTEPEIDNSVVIRGTPDNLMWQKERLINIAVAQLPPDIRTVAWVDHDIVFANPNWLVESQRMIDAGLDAVQPFTTVKYQGRDGRVERTAKSAASVALAGGNPSTGPGAAWVASRQWLQSIGGLYDRNIVGGGDATFFEAVSKRRTAYRDRQSAASQRHIDQWVSSIGPVRYGCLPGSVRHLWHGDFSNRQYVTRDAILRRFNFDPDIHIAITPDGLLQWTKAAPAELKSAVRTYFENRREDG